jgi:hypothetical protein
MPAVRASEVGPVDRGSGPAGSVDVCVPDRKGCARRTRLCVDGGAIIRNDAAQRGSSPLRVGIDLFRRVDRKARRNMFHRQVSPHEPDIWWWWSSLLLDFWWTRILLPFCARSRARTGRPKSQPTFVPVLYTFGDTRNSERGKQSDDVFVGASHALR